VQVYINRAKALLLVGTISAGGACSDDDGSPDNGAAGTAGARAGTGGSTPFVGGSGQGGGAGAGGTPSAGGSGQGGGGAGTGGTPSAGGSGQSGPDAGTPDAGTPDAGDPDTPDAGGDGGTPTCNDTADTLVDCAGVEGVECGEEEGFLSFECEMLEFNMKPATANAARDCMISLDPPELCVEANTYGCMVDALASSCPDPEADDECTAIATVCDDPPIFSTCAAALSGMTQDGRDQMVQCMTTVTCDLVACIEDLTF
jgi:hypothetical protein